MDPYLGEIKILACTFAPRGWAFCQGQLLAIAQNQALFSLLGTTYGGNGVNNFALPDLRGRVPMHAGGGFTLGEAGGEEVHTLNSTELPAHTHGVNGFNTPATTASATGNKLAGATAYASAVTLAALNPQSVAVAGGSQAHENRQPYLALNFCIALTGVFPSRS